MKQFVGILMALLLLMGCVCLADTGLPPYTYTGSDPVEGAAAEYAITFGDQFLKEEGMATIPAPVIHKTEEVDADHLRVYTTLWVFNYQLKGSVLECISGGEFPGILTLVQKDGKWVAENWEQAGDGSEYGKDIERFSKGDPDLKEAYFGASDAMAEPTQGIRTNFIRDYVSTNGLSAEAYQDYGWEPVRLQ
ncbi:MAG: hypothetical protein IJ088_05815 [Clostridia bacterium]|nr:hypothetical protein [Clostridia bacterium]